MCTQKMLCQRLYFSHKYRNIIPLILAIMVNLIDIELLVCDSEQFFSLWQKINWKSVELWFLHPLCTQNDFVKTCLLQLIFENWHYDMKSIINIQTWIQFIFLYPFTQLWNLWKCLHWKHNLLFGIVCLIIEDVFMN